MRVLDFYRSFTVFEIDFGKRRPRTVSDLRQNTHNRARIRIDCRCTITDRKGSAHDFYLGESNKSERVGAGRELGIFTQPNADYRPIHSTEDSLILKSWDRNNKGVMLDPPSLGPQPERNLVKTREAYYTHRFQLIHVEGTELKSAREIIAATDAGLPLVGLCQYEENGYQVELEYPVGTINVSEKHGSYQTDTGPLIFPDLSQPFERLAETLWLAFSSLNSPDWIEFIIRKPTPLTHDISVNHYSESRWVDRCRNTIVAAA
jgi:hypothetical protein